jgi:hypothetical protein
MDWKELEGELPREHLVEALDDNGDGEADAAAWAAAQADAQERIADAFGGAVPARHAGAAAYARKMFLCEMLFRRRGLSGDRNPFSAQAAKAEDRLRRLATGAETPEGAGGGTAYSEPAKVAGVGGLMA